jgi:hypothetical protein
MKEDMQQMKTKCPHCGQFRPPPTPKSGTPFQVARFVEQLRENSGEWLVYCTGNIARTAHSKAQQYKVRYPGTEWVARREEGGYTVFGRWVG